MALVGIEPTTSGFQGMYSEPAVGLYSMGDELKVANARCFKLPNEGIVETRSLRVM